MAEADKTVLRRGIIAQQAHQSQQNQAGKGGSQPQTAIFQKLLGAVQSEYTHTAKKKHQYGENNLHCQCANAGHDQIQHEKNNRHDQQNGHDLLKKTVAGLIVIHNAFLQGDFLYSITIPA